MAWRAARSLAVFHNQLKVALPGAAPPHTPASAWGTVGDEDHASTSDHSPKDFPGWGNDIVTAADWPHAPALGLDAGRVAESLRQSRDGRIKYVIWNRRMFSSYAVSGTAAWGWRSYSGSDPHTGHGHLSLVGDPRADGQQAWSVGYAPPPPPPPAPEEPMEKWRVVQELVAGSTPPAGTGPTWLSNGVVRVPVADVPLTTQWVLPSLVDFLPGAGGNPITYVDTPGAYGPIIGAPATVTMSASDRAAIVTELKTAVLAELGALVPSLDEIKAAIEAAEDA